jgi:hypothetical protein
MREIVFKKIKIKVGHTWLYLRISVQDRFKPGVLYVRSASTSKCPTLRVIVADIPNAVWCGLGDMPSKEKEDDPRET